LKKYLSAALTAARNLWHREPVRVTGSVASALLVVAAHFGLVLPKATVIEAVSVILPIVLGAGEVARARVKPAKT